MRVVESWQLSAMGHVGRAPLLWLGSAKVGTRLHAVSNGIAAFDLLPVGHSTRRAFQATLGSPPLAATTVEGRGPPVVISANGTVDTYGWTRPPRRAECFASDSQQLLAATFDAGDPSHAWALDAQGFLVSLRAPSGSWLSCLATATTASRASGLSSSPGRLVTAGCDGSLELWVTQAASDAPKSVSRLTGAMAATLLREAGVQTEERDATRCSWPRASIAITTRAMATAMNDGRIVVGSELLTPPGHVSPAQSSYVFILSVRLQIISERGKPPATEKCRHCSS